jgi:F-type H+-transporting ATPase subunit delta
MKNYLVAHRYAKALSDSIEDNAQCESVSMWLNEFARLLEEHGALRTVLTNPAIDAPTRAAILDDVLAKSEANPLGANLVRTALRRDRIGILGDIATVFREFVDDRLSRVTATVTSAKTLDDNQLDRIRSGLTNYSNKDVRIETGIDPAILGGVIVHIDGAVMDGSLRTRLEQLRSALLSEDNES